MNFSNFPTINTRYVHPDPFCNNFNSNPIDLLSHLNSTLNMTIQQIIDRLRVVTKERCSDHPVTIVVLYLFIFSGSLGMISYLVMLASLNRSKSKLSKCTMIYHRATVIFEFPHLFITILCPALALFPPSDLDATNYIWMVWKSRFIMGWAIGDCFKFGISVITFFITLERFVGICVPTKFSKINVPQVAYGAVAVSFFFGTSHFWAILGKRVEYRAEISEYEIYDTDFSKKFFYNFVLQFIYVTKLTLCSCIFVLCLATVVGLRRKASKVAFMSSANAVEEMKMSRRLCAFSSIIGSCVVLDHVFWVLYQELVVAWVYPTVEEVMLGQVDPHDAEHEQVLFIAWHIYVCMGLLVHSYRFFMYLAFTKSMREGLMKLIKRSA